MPDECFVVEAAKASGQWQVVTARPTHAEAEREIAARDAASGRYVIIYRVRRFVPAKGEKNA